MSRKAESAIQITVTTWFLPAEEVEELIRAERGRTVSSSDRAGDIWGNRWIFDSEPDVDPASALYLARRIQTLDREAAARGARPDRLSDPIRPYGVEVED